MSADSSLRAALAALADQLSQRREQILSNWAAALDTDPELSSFSTLSRAQFNDHIPARLEVLETRSPARLKFGGSLPDGIRVSGGHKTGMRRANARSLRR